VTAAATELIAYLREHTPERAAVPVALHFVDPMPLTAVGKIFKPALRIDAARRVVEQLLEGVASCGATFATEVLPHGQHGQIVRVSIAGVQGEPRDQLVRAVHERLGPLTIRHEVV
jgi:fatty-acyl-CoA synthase